MSVYIYIYTHTICIYLFINLFFPAPLNHSRSETPKCKRPGINSRLLRSEEAGSKSDEIVTLGKKIHRSNVIFQFKFVIF